MGMRELVAQAIRMRNAGADREEIYSHLWKNAKTLGMIRGNGDHEAFEITLVETGETIFFNDTNGYCYKRQ